MPKSKPAQNKLPKGWTQTDRSAHDTWFKLTMRHPRASALMHLLAARCSPFGKVVVSHKDLKILMGVKSVTTVKSTLKVLTSWNFILVESNAKWGDINTYVLNNHVVWASKREHLKFSSFKAEPEFSQASQQGQKPSGTKPPSELPYGDSGETMDPETGEITTLADPRDLRDAA